MTRRRKFVALGAVVVAIAAGVVIGWPRDQPVSQGDVSINRISSDLAIKGYDPVAYFTVGEPVEGEPAYQVTHDGATCRFASEEHMAMFQADPAAYTPAYGGYCSYGVRQGMKFDIDPTAFEIVDEQLYLQLDPGTRLVWQQDLLENIMIADQIWPEIENLTPEDLPRS